MKLAIPVSPFNQFPIRSFRLVIWFLLCWIRVELWKNAVFLSPSTTQEILDFILQNSASKVSIADNSLRSDFSSSIRKLFGLLPNAVWIPLSLAHICFFLCKIFLKCSLFQALTFVVNVVIALERVDRLDQASLTRLTNEGWLSHIDWNRKGWEWWVPWSCLKERRTGLWSKWD